MISRQANAFRQLSAEPVVDTKWIVDYGQKLDEAAHSLHHDRAMTNAAETEFLEQAQKKSQGPDPGGANGSRYATASVEHNPVRGLPETRDASTGLAPHEGRGRASQERSSEPNSTL